MELDAWYRINASNNSRLDLWIAHQLPTEKVNKSEVKLSHF